MNNKFVAKGVKLSAVLSLMLATGCAELYKRALQDTQAQGPEFSRELAREYEALGDTEQAIMYDEYSATYYFRKAIRAKEGCPVVPTILSNWRLDKDRIPELSRARDRLVHALEYGAWEVAPKTSAHAQAYFDSWVEQEAEEWQKEDIAACRAEFYKAMANVELMLMGGFANVYPNSMIFFELGNAHLDHEALKVIDEIADIAKSNKYADHILLVGRTDEIGDAKHNKNLSQHRAAMVKKELIRRGVSPHHISIEAAGETPGPNVDAHNRRVDIIFLSPYK